MVSDFKMGYCITPETHISAGDRGIEEEVQQIQSFFLSRDRRAFFSLKIW